MDGQCKSIKASHDLRRSLSMGEEERPKSVRGRLERGLVACLHGAPPSLGHQQLGPSALFRLGVGVDFQEC